jgi:voltage-gated potassium channel
MIQEPRQTPIPVSRQQADRSAKKLIVAILTLILTAMIGTAGYVIIEGWTIGDALYMTVISITTTGFGEVRDLSPAGRVLTAIVIVGGIATLAYTAGRVLQLAVEVYLLRRGRMDKKIARLKGHVILCGYGRMGRHIADDLDTAAVPFVVVEKDTDNVAEMEERGFLYLLGDSSSDELLKQAGVEKAKGLIAVVSSDAENVYTTLTAKSINPTISIVARALTDESEPKLRTAGADRVIKPYEMVGRRIAQLIIRPTMVEFVESIARSATTEITIEEITVAESSAISGMALGSTTIRKDLNVIIVAIRRESGDFIYNPKTGTEIHGGDKLICIGNSDRMADLAEICGVDGVVGA